MPQMYPRKARPLVLDALADTRVVFVTGARQVGKSTLARGVVEGEHAARVIDLDDAALRDAARADPTGFVAGLDGPVLIDEVQRAPDLLFAIKERVDRDPRPGRFLLTGSANVFATSTVREALTGRIETIPLWPLTQSEIHGGRSNLVDALLAGEPLWVDGAPVGRAAFAALVAQGGYPEARLRTGRRRSRWFANYVDDTLTTDLRDISSAHQLQEMPRLLRVLAAQAAGEVVYRNLASKLDLNHETVKNYISLLEAVFLVRLLPAWRPGIGRREVHAPKGYVVDSGLLAHLLGADESRIANDDQITGSVLENFVAMEVLRLSEWASTDARLYHYRQRAEEIDLVLETRAGRIAAIEVKASATVRRADYAPMAKLRDSRPEAFAAGVVVYTGAQTIPLGDRLWAIPVSALWA